MACSLACVESGEVLTPGSTRGDDQIPLRLPLPNARVSIGYEHACAVVAGRGYCWGDNTSGQVGVGSDEPRLEPNEVGSGRWQQIVAGARHSCGMDTEGNVYCWGDNERGQLGQGQRLSARVPTRVALSAPARAISAGFSHSCAILETAELACWGEGAEGQLARADAFDSRSPLATDSTLPVAPVAPGTGAGGVSTEAPDAGRAGPEPTIGWIAVTTGQGHTCAIREDRSLWCWGRNSEGELGVRTEAAQSRVPVEAAGGHEWASVSAGQNYTCGLLVDGSLWCWGENTGQCCDEGFPLGIESRILDTPTRVGDGTWMALDTHTFHTCAVNQALELWCWGRNIDGQIGEENDEVLERAPAFVADGVARVSVGRFSTCMVSTGGAIQCAGQNFRGQLGRGREPPEWIFANVELPSPVESD